MRLYGFFAACQILLSMLSLNVCSGAPGNSVCVPGVGGTVFSTGDDVQVTIIQGSIPSYNSDLYYYDSGSLGSVLCGSGKDYGHATTLTNLAPSNELIFFIYVHETGSYWYSGDVARNFDHSLHSKVDCGTNGTAIMGFEDLANGGDFSYNDVTFTITRLPAPARVATPPADVRVNTGATATLSVEAGGTRPVYYQWLKEGVPIRAATNSTLEIAGAREVDQGAYSVVVSNALGLATSKSAQLVVNQVPQANATATTLAAVSRNGTNATVLLDASRSVDADGNYLQFTWFEAGNPAPIGYGPLDAVRMPLGTHQLTLLARDASLASSNQITVQVLTPAQGLQRLITLTEAQVARPKPLTATLSAAIASLQRGNLTAAQNQLGTFQNQVRAQVAPGNAALASMLTSAAQDVIAVWTDAPAELRTVALSPFEVQLAWNDSTGAEPSSFRIQQLADDGKFKQIAELPSGSRKFRSRNLFPATSYTYRIQPVAGTISSNLTNSRTVQTLQGPCTFSIQQFGWAFGEIVTGIQKPAAISLGSQHALALQSDGKIVAWGADYNGQGEVPESVGRAQMISAANEHNLAVRTNGTVAAWGSDSYAESEPPTGLSGVVSVAAGDWHGLALKNDGTVVGWGNNLNGEANPRAGLRGVVAIAAGGSHSLALLSDGTVVGWGNDAEGQAKPPPGLSNVVEIAAGEAHSMALLADGTVVCWGVNSNGELIPPSGLERVTGIAASYHNSIALTGDHELIGWGNNAYGQSSTHQDVWQIASGFLTTLALSPRPAQPLQLLPAIPGTNSIQITWTDNSTDEDGFVLERSEDYYRWVLMAELAAGATQFVDSGVVLNAQYSYRIRAHSSCGFSEYTPSQGILFSVPAIPVNLSASINPTGGVDVAWYHSGYTTSFSLERAADQSGVPGSWSQLASIPPNLQGADYYRDRSVTLPGGVWYRVKALNGLGASDFSDPVFLDVTPPPVPSRVSAYGFRNSIVLQWFEDRIGHNGFRIQRANDIQGEPGAWEIIATNRETYSGWHSFTDPSRTLGAGYWYRVQALSWVGDSEYTDPVSGFISVPGAPVSLFGSVANTNQVQVDWSVQVNDQDGFLLERAPDAGGAPGAWNQIANIAATNQSGGSFVDGNALAFTTNWYRVRAYNFLGTSEYSEATAVPIVPPPTPFASVSVVTDTLYLSYYNQYYQPEGFVVERAADASGAPGAWETISTQQFGQAGSGQYADSGHVAGTTYWYRVRAFSWVGFSDYSDPVHGTIIPPAVPYGGTASLGDTNQVVLAWYEYPTDQSGFWIEKAADVNNAPGAWTVIASNFLAQYYYATLTDTNARAYTTNWYRIRAFNSVGYSDFCQPFSVAVIPPPAPYALYAYALRDTVQLSWYSFYLSATAGYVIERAPDAGGQAGAWTQIKRTTDTLTEYIDPTRNAGATYWYRVRAYSWVGDSEPSYSASATIIPPSPPYYLNPQIGATNEVLLSWYDYAQDEDGFTIERAREVNGGPGTWREIGVVFATNEFLGSFVDTNVQAFTTNYYRVRAFNIVGQSAYSDPSRVELVPPSTPYVYGQPSADTISLYWYSSYLGILQGTRVERAPNNAGTPGAWVEVANVVGSTNGFSDPGLAPNTTYWYRVRNYSWIGISAFSDPVAVTIVPPAAPYYVYAYMAPSNTVTVQWYHSPSDASGFRVERAPDAGGVPGGWSEIGSFSATNLSYASYNDTNALPNTTNWYRVRAYNAAGISDYSLAGSLAVVAPGAPFNLIPQLGSATQVDLYWYSPNGFVEGYVIERAADTNGVPGAYSQLSRISNYNQTGYSDTSVHLDKTYWYRIRAFNWVGNSVPSDSAAIRVGAPGAPQNLMAINDWKNQISVNWNAPTGFAAVVNYGLERASDAAGRPGTWASITVTSSSITNYVDTNLATNKTYWYRVRAINNAGNSPYSALAHATVRSGSFVRVMQWNVERNLGRLANNNNYAPASIGRIVNANQPDVLLFNEIDTQGLTVQQNTDALINWVTNNAFYLGTRPGQDFYVAISSQSDGFIRNGAISRFPLSGATTYNDGLRGLHSFEVQVSPANSLQVFHAHLKCCADDCGRKQAEAQFDGSVIGAFAATNGLPYLFAGDWNEEEEKPTPVCTLSDVYHPITTIRTLAGLSEFRPTMLNGEYRTWSTAETSPSIRFDYMLAASNRLAAESGYVFNSSQWANQGRYGNYYDSYYASDHYCVFGNYYFEEPGMSVSAATLSASGYQGGPFIPSNQVYIVSNVSTGALTWALGGLPPWLSATAANGTLGVGEHTNISVSINTAAADLTTALFQAMLRFTNGALPAAPISRPVALEVLKPTRLVVSPASGLNASGLQGGPFFPHSQVYSLSNAGISTMSWSASSSAPWLTLSLTNGSLAAGAATNVTVTLNDVAGALVAADYSGLITFRNDSDDSGTTTRSVFLSIGSFGFFDDFSTFTPGNLVGKQSWAQALAPSSAPLQISSGQVVMPGGQTSDNQDAFKNFIPTNDVTFYGFNMQITSAPGSANPSYFAALYTSNNATGFANYRLSARDITGGLYALGGRVTGQTGSPYTFGAVGLGYGTRHRVIVQTDATGASMKLFVDPTSANLDEQVPYCTAAIGSGSPPPQIGSLVLSQFGNASAPSVGVGIAKAVVSSRYADIYNFLLGQQTVASSFQEDFESGTLDNWTTLPSPATPLDISTAQEHSPGGFFSARVDSSSDRMYRNIGSEVTAPYRATFWMYDNTAANQNTGQTRWFGELRGYSGTGFGSGSLQQLLAIGRYGIGFGTGTGFLVGETVNTANYQGRVLSGANTGIFNVLGLRSVGWHKFDIEVAADGTTVNFYVDNALGRSIPGATAATIDSVVIGSIAAGAVSGEAWFDDISVNSFTVPQNAVSGFASQAQVPVAPQIIGIEFVPQGVRITWTTSAASRDVVQSAPSPSGPFVDVSDTVITPGTGTKTASYIDPSANTNAGVRLYRIVSRQQQ
jgi:hypothetical protein